MSKKKNRFKFYITVAVLAGLAVLMVKHFHISNFNIVQSDTLYISGQPRGMDYTRLLYKYHIGTIVNLRPASEHREQNWYAEEVGWVKQNGVSYIELPIDKNNYLPDKDTQEKFLAVMADKKNLPVLLHGSGNTERAAMLAAVWLVKTQGLTPAQTETKLESILERAVN